jgi:hypothetical protein
MISIDICPDSSLWSGESHNKKPRKSKTKD